jgi:hypothetical protein
MRHFTISTIVLIVHLDSIPVYLQSVAYYRIREPCEVKDGSCLPSARPRRIRREGGTFRVRALSKKVLNLTVLTVRAVVNWQVTPLRVRGYAKGNLLGAHGPKGGR